MARYRIQLSQRFYETQVLDLETGQELRDVTALSIQVDAQHRLTQVTLSRLAREIDVIAAGEAVRMQWICPTCRQPLPETSGDEPDRDAKANPEASPEKERL